MNSRVRTGTFGADGVAGGICAYVLFAIVETASAKRMVVLFKAVIPFFPRFVVLNVDEAV
jgi:hypothetical protein